MSVELTKAIGDTGLVETAGEIEPTEALDATGLTDASDRAELGAAALEAADSKLNSAVSEADGSGLDPAVLEAAELEQSAPGGDALPGVTEPEHIALEGNTSLEKVGPIYAAVTETGPEYAASKETEMECRAPDEAESEFSAEDMDKAKRLVPDEAELDFQTARDLFDQMVRTGTEATDCRVQMEFLETVDYYGVRLEGMVTLYVLKKVERYVGGGIVNPLQSVRDLIDTVSPLLCSSTRFWWCRQISAPEEEGIRLLILNRPDETAKLLFFSTVALAAGRVDFYYQLTTCRRCKDCVNVVSLDRTMAKYVEGLDGRSLEEFVDARRQEILKYYTDQYEAETQKRAEERDERRRNLMGQWKYKPAVIKLQDKISAWAKSDRADYHVDDYVKRNLEISFYDEYFYVGEKSFAYSAEGIARAEACCDDRMRYYEKRKLSEKKAVRARELYEEFVEAAGRFPITMYDHVRGCPVLRMNNRVSGMFRSSLVMEISRDGVSLKYDGRTVYTYDFLNSRQDEEPEARAAVDEAYRATRSWLGKIYDRFCGI